MNCRIKADEKRITVGPVTSRLMSINKTLQMTPNTHFIYDDNHL